MSKKCIRNTTVVVERNDSIDSVIRLMSERSKEVDHPGLAVVLEEGRLIGLITDGDIRRAYSANISFVEPVSTIMVTNPVTLVEGYDPNYVSNELAEKLSKKGGVSSGLVRHIPIVSKDGLLIDIVDFMYLSRNSTTSLSNRTAVFGLGYVGLTLSVALATRSIEVLGIDTNKALIDALARGEPHIHEPGLDSLMRRVIDSDKLHFSTEIPGTEINVYIISVGTPLDSTGTPDLSALKSVLDSIGRKLKRDDLVMLRSTVPLGTTRQVVIPMLEALSGLECGIHFSVAFTPERTVEGKALQELIYLPQIIGGFTAKCSDRASKYWSKLAHHIVSVDSLEAAEVVKLANNTFRDLSFAFANELAMLCDNYNVNAFETIQAANEGYPRNRIPLPSPGVGGYCLTKDPLLYGSTPFGKMTNKTLGNYSREINERATFYPLKHLERFAESIGRRMCELEVLAIGMAFKGVPETTDLRGSTSVELVSKMQILGMSVVVADAVVSIEDLQNSNLPIWDQSARGIDTFDAVLLLNNHPLNHVFLKNYKPEKSVLVFDGWSLFSQSDFTYSQHVVYSTMGAYIEKQHVQK